MDVMTHMLIGYLLPYGMGIRNETLHALCAIAAIIPDFDIFFFPLSRRVKALQHRTVTHSVPFILTLGLVLGILASHYLGVPFLHAFAMVVLGAGSHTLADLFTDYPIRPFYPFYNRYYSFNYERGINFIMLGFSGTMIILLLNLRGTALGRIYFSYLMTLAYVIVGGGIAIRVLFRAIVYLRLKQYIRSEHGGADIRTLRRKGRHTQRNRNWSRAGVPTTAVHRRPSSGQDPGSGQDPETELSILPSITPFLWTVAVHDVVPRGRMQHTDARIAWEAPPNARKEYRLRYTRMYPWSKDIEFHHFSWYDLKHSIGSDENGEETIDTLSKALTYSYSYANNISKFEKFGMLLPHVEHAKTRRGDQWTVFWYPVRLIMGGRAYGVEVSLSAQGEPEVKARFRKITKPDLITEETIERFLVD